MLHARLRAAAGDRGGIPTRGLVSHYDMNSISGSTLIDGNGNYDGTISGATVAAGFNGNALSFDGINDQVSFGNAWAEMSSDFTIASRYNQSKGDSVVVSKYPSFPSFFELLGGSSSYYAGAITGNGASSNNVTIDNKDIRTFYGTWPCVVIVFSSGTLNLYINDMATPVATAAFSRNISNQNSDGYIGRRAFSGSEAYFGGEIDSVALYSEALNEPERIALLENA